MWHLNWLRFFSIVLVLEGSPINCFSFLFFCYSIQYQHSVGTFQLSLLSTLSPCFIHVYRRGCGRDVVDEDVLSERDGPRDRLILLPVSSWIFFKIFSKTGMCKIRVTNCEFYKCQNVVSIIAIVMRACSVFNFKAQEMIHISAFLTYISYILQYDSSDK